MISTVRGISLAMRWRIKRSTLSTGEPCTWGRTWREHEAYIGTYTEHSRFGRYK